MDIMSMIPQLIGGLVLLVVAVALMLMSRGGKSKGMKKSAGGDTPTPAALPGGGQERVLVGVGARSAEGGLHPEVMDLVQKQPEEIAVLLRSWLADRR
jgi:flagellar biosynthesis/type III secretory pathway M-ring protein FliF/YscJ